MRELGSRAWQLEPDHVGRWVAALAGLHDLGKAMPGFQAKWPAGCKALIRAGLPFDAPALFCDQHLLATCTFLTPLLQQASSAPTPWCQQAVQAISAHHGDHFLPVERDGGKPRREAPTGSAARQSLFDAKWATVHPPSPPEAEAMDLPMVNWLAGLTSVATGVLPTPSGFPWGENGGPPRLLRARPRACRAGAGCGVLAPSGRCFTSRPRPANWITCCAAWWGAPTCTPARCRAGPALLRRQGPGLAAGGSPDGGNKDRVGTSGQSAPAGSQPAPRAGCGAAHQATRNALFLRASHFLRALADGPLDVQLVHSGAGMNSS